MSQNFLKIVVSTLEEEGKKPADILWCGSQYFGYCTWEEFQKKADFEVGFGLEGEFELEGGKIDACDDSIAEDLVIVGKDFWLEWFSDANSLYWLEYRELPKKPPLHKPNMDLYNKNCYRKSLKEIN